MPPAELPSPIDRHETRSVRFAARLPADDGTAGVARRLIRVRLGQHVAPLTLEDVVLVVSELVTNAVRHGRGNVELRVAFDGERVKGEVRDEGGGFTRQRRTPASGAAGGSGLSVVEQLASAWGVQDGSARVWFEIADRAAALPVRLN